MLSSNEKPFYFEPMEPQEVFVDSERLWAKVELVSAFRILTLVLLPTELHIHSTYNWSVIPAEYTEVRTCSLESRVKASRLQDILSQLQPQRLRLLLYFNLNRVPSSKLFATIEGKEVEFNLCNEFCLDCR